MSIISATSQRWNLMDSCLYTSQKIYSHTSALINYFPETIRWERPPHSQTTLFISFCKLKFGFSTTCPCNKLFLSFIGILITPHPIKATMLIHITPLGPQRRHVFLHMAADYAEKNTWNQQYSTTWAWCCHECESCHVMAVSAYIGTALCIYWRHKPTASSVVPHQ